VLVPAVVAGAGLLAACASGPGADHVTQRPIEDVLAEHSEAWMDLPGVEGTGIGLCGETPCIRIFVSRPTESFAGVLPDSVEGHPIDLESTGTFEPR
jgi:hypothetical protein